MIIVLIPSLRRLGARVNKMLNEASFIRGKFGAPGEYFIGKEYISIDQRPPFRYPERMSRYRQSALLAALLFIGAAFAACGPSADQYYPLKLGNVWEYKTSYPDGRSMTDGDQIIRRYESAYYFNNGEVIIRLSSDALISRNGVRILHHPFQPGTRWRDRGIELTITSVGDRIETPAGVFEDTITVVWDTTRKGPVTMSADAFISGPVSPTSPEAPLNFPGMEERRDYPLRRFLSTTVFARNVGPVRYKLDAAEIGQKMRNVLVSDLTSYELR